MAEGIARRTARASGYAFGKPDYTACPRAESRFFTLERPVRSGGENSESRRYCTIAHSHFASQRPMHLLKAQPGVVADGSEAVDLGQTPGDIVVLWMPERGFRWGSVDMRRMGRGATKW